MSQEDEKQQPNITFVARHGEMHCIETVPSTFERINIVANTLGLNKMGNGKEGSSLLTQAVVWW